MLLGPGGCGPARETPAPQRARTGRAASVTSASGDRRPPLPGIEPTLRIRVASFSNTNASKALVLGAAGSQLWVSTPELDRPGRIVLGPMKVLAGKGGWTIEGTGRRRGGREVIQTATPLAIAAVGRGAIQWNDAPLEGLLRVVRPSGGKPGEFDLVTHVAMERYLPGVLERELFTSWPVATFEAQAIAARSFAVCERAFWLSRRHYDVVAGPSSQAWSGGVASSRARAAVSATIGHVLVWDRRVVPAYYSASCGGIPASATDAIGGNPSNAIPPLTVSNAEQRRDQGCCEESPYGSWTVSFNRSEIVKALNKAGKSKGPKAMTSITHITSIDVLSRNPAGRPVEYRLSVDAGRTIPIGAEALRRALNIDRASNRIRSSYVAYDVTPSEVLARGHGWGHGVGLCQYGAKTMGRAGRSANEILQRYYPSATIAQGWETSRPIGQYVGA